MLSKMMEWGKKKKVGVHDIKHEIMGKNTYCSCGSMFILELRR